MTVTFKPHKKSISIILVIAFLYTVFVPIARVNQGPIPSNHSVYQLLNDQLQPNYSPASRKLTVKHQVVLPKLSTPPMDTVPRNMAWFELHTLFQLNTADTICLRLLKLKPLKCTSTYY
ncbi:hypothetical protein [Paenibacillus sp. 1001270B_150601_E10]|uniref:hypothetical protein n=1 Tax=Paenibacillus sp. 1001270B_150601_E10 TaxID=2787079 RepID=UPI00189E9345|nr:hypothetical protein [Paenibacillus sp. 1001270B_150601_E10]